MVHVRDAVEADLLGLLEIYNDVIATTTAVYRDEPATFQDRLAWWAARAAQGAWPGYRFGVEHSLHVRADRRGSGVGQALMHPLIDRARALGKHVMMAGVDADTAGSIRFHGAGLRARRAPARSRLQVRPAAGSGLLAGFLKT